MKWWAPAGVGAALLAVSAHAQMPMGHAMADSSREHAIAWSLGAQAIGLVTKASPAHAGRSLTEGYLTQPMVMGSLSAFAQRLALEGMLDLEGITLERGELDGGIWGEGYIDRRHPHTYLHELVATVNGSSRVARYSLTVGKGFAPFGTDDPMVRPFAKYPINHHIAQIVERLVATAAVRTGPLVIEAASFNGDEPESPSDLPNGSRLWDSWAGRVTLLPAAGIEIQASGANVKSPELATGGGLDQRKVNLSLRYEGGQPDEMSMGGEPAMEGMDMPASSDTRWHRYALVEWGRSVDLDRGTRVFSFTTALAEAELRNTRLSFAARFETTVRPEEERLADPFRTPLPATDFSIAGRTRWDIISARVSANVAQSRSFGLTPFIEISRQYATALSRPAIFDPRTFYGSNRMWGLSAGVTIAAGMLHRRAGHYGAATVNR